MRIRIGYPDRDAEREIVRNAGRHSRRKHTRR
jgi:hypothetical protein